MAACMLPPLPKQPARPRTAALAAAAGVGGEAVVTHLLADFPRRLACSQPLAHKVNGLGRGVGVE